MSVPRTGPARHRGRSADVLAAAAAAALLLLAGSCGSSAPSNATAVSPPTSAGGGGAVAAGTPCTSRPGSVCVTEQARGHTVQLRPGWTLTLRLGASGRTFGAPRQSGGNVLEALGRPHQSGSELIASFRAVRAGTAQLRATERPLCRPGTACPDYIALWTLTVVVKR